VGVFRAVLRHELVLLRDRGAFYVNNIVNVDASFLKLSFLPLSECTLRGRLLLLADDIERRVPVHAAGHSHAYIR
jgi:hypothetical protein